MEAKNLFKKDWTPTPEAFDKMLGWLDSDREKAAEEYEKIRQKLIKLFKWRNCRPEEDYADITINRVMRRISEEVDASKDKPYLYFHGTALNVLREFWRGQQKHKHEDFENILPLELTTENPQQLIEKKLEQQKETGRFNCMRECLNELSPEAKAMIMEYHHGESKKNVRQELAEKMNISMNVLRIKACRVRADLQNCVEKCVKKI